MKFCTFDLNGRSCVGVKISGGVVNISAIGFPETINEVIAGGSEMLARISDVLGANAHSPLCEDDLKFLPVTKPKKIICKGLNYRDHALETGKDAPQHPVFFSKFNDSLSAHGEPVHLPPWLKKFDHEAELVIVIGSYAYNVTPENAEAHIFGYTCGNDLSARDAQALSSQWIAGKALPGFAPTGPFIVTRDSFDPRESHGVFCEINGVTAQAGNTTDMIFPCFDIVSAASLYFPLNPGDLIFTGTPAGVIMGRKKEDRCWLKPGDVVTVKIDGIGELRTPLV